MATTDKNFKIKNGLVVQGTTATVNGNDVLLDTETDINHILSFIDVIDGGELSIVTPPSLPDNPINLTVLSVTTNSISVGWSAPISGGIVEGYRVYILPYTTDPATIQMALLAEPTARTPETSYTFTGLAAETPYLILIGSYNDEGDSQTFEGLTPLILSNIPVPITTQEEVP